MKPKLYIDGEDTGLEFMDSAELSIGYDDEIKDKLETLNKPSKCKCKAKVSYVPDSTSEVLKAWRSINNFFKSFISTMSRKDKLTIIKCINIKNRTKSFRIRKKHDSRIRGIIRKYIGEI